jgi:hypothetical protein
VPWLSVVIRNLLALVLGFFALPWCLDVLLTTIRLHQTWPRFPAAVAMGLVFGLALPFWRKPNLLILTLVHEACHFVMCALLFVRIEGITATRKRGGEVEHVAADPLRDTLIAIAPYTLPLLLGPFLLARMWWSEGWAGAVLSGLCAFFFVTHLQGVVLNVRGNFWGSDADLPRVGRFLSLVLIAGVALLLTAGVIQVLWAGAAVRQGT